MMEKDDPMLRPTIKRPEFRAAMKAMADRKAQRLRMIAEIAEGLAAARAAREVSE